MTIRRAIAELAVKWRREVRNDPRPDARCAGAWKSAKLSCAEELDALLRTNLDRGEQLSRAARTVYMKLRAGAECDEAALRGLGGALDVYEFRDTLKPAATGERDD